MAGDRSEAEAYRRAAYSDAHVPLTRQFEALLYSGSGGGDVGVSTRGERWETGRFEGSFSRADVSLAEIGDRMEELRTPAWKG